MEITEDYLTEDPVLSTQRYFLLSYILPKKGHQGIPMIKMRGAYRSIEECQEKVESLKKLDNSIFDIFIAEVGKWGGLYPVSKVITDSSVDVQYDEADKNYKIMNQMMKGYKENELKVDKFYEERKRKLMAGELDDEEYNTVEERLKIIESRLKSVDQEKEELRIIKERLQKITVVSESLE